MLQAAQGLWVIVYFLFFHFFLYSFTLFYSVPLFPLRIML